MFEHEIEVLESEWSPDGGFFWQIREGRFVESEFQQALRRISSISIAEDATVPVRLVSLLWYIPLFMQWQTERVRANGADMSVYEQAITLMTNELGRLLGVP
jgi:hypothetical protein